MTDKAKITDSKKQGSNFRVIPVVTPAIPLPTPTFYPLTTDSKVP